MAWPHRADGLPARQVVEPLQVWAASVQVSQRSVEVASRPPKSSASPVVDWAIALLVRAGGMVPNVPYQFEPGPYQM